MKNFLDYLPYGIFFIVLFISLYLLVSMISKNMRLKKIASVLKSASELQKSGDINGALELLKANLNVFSMHDPIFASYISFLIANGRFDNAIAILTEMTKDPKEEFGAVNMLAYIATLREKFGEAEQYYQKALELDPGKKKAIYTNLAVLYAEQGIKLDEAIGMLNEVLAIEDGSNKYPAYVNLGYALYRKKEFDQALINEKIGLELIPKGENFDSIRGFSHYVMGLILKEQKKFANAKEELLIARQFVKNPAFVKKVEHELDGV